MLYYLGKGTEFKKEECKEYKTLKNVLAAAKDEVLTVWDENGVVVGGLADNEDGEDDWRPLSLRTVWTRSVWTGVKSGKSITKIMIPMYNKTIAEHMRLFR